MMISKAGLAGCSYLSTEEYDATLRHDDGQLTNELVRAGRAEELAQLHMLVLPADDRSDIEALQVVQGASLTQGLPVAERDRAGVSLGLGRGLRGHCEVDGTGEV